ncbi:MAG: hypothetical protein HY243_18735 [Proteobacteria bacterium]|nr:hypothetical protein [Pseudomonadota bacterium]
MTAEDRAAVAREPFTALRLPVAPLSSPLYEAAAVMALCPVLLVIAIWNGFPITFFDTGAYILQGMGHVFVPERGAVYSFFLNYAGGETSLWWVVIAQSLLTSFVLVQFARAEARETSLWNLLGLVAALSFLTGIAWYAGQLEPDIFAGVTVLCVWLLAFRLKEMGIARAFFVFLIGAFAIASHPSHFGLGAGLAGAVVLYRLALVFWQKRLDLPRANAWAPMACFACGLSLVLVANYALTQQVFVSRSGPVFVFARMLQDGLVKRFLAEECPDPQYKLCKFRNELPKNADAYLWETHSVFTKLGRFEGSEVESDRVVNEILKRYPFAVTVAVFKNAAVQFGYFLTGDGIEPQEWVLNAEFERFIPHQMRAYTSARQQRADFHFLPLNIVHVSVAILSQLALGWLLLVDIRRRDWRALILPAFVFVALMGNALICGALSGPHGRYQSRLIWLPTFVLALTVAPKLEFSLRRAVESGT